MTKISKFAVAFVMLLLCFSFNSYAQQDTEEYGPTYIGQASNLRVAPSLASRTNLIPADTAEEKEALDGRSSRGAVVPGKGTSGDDELAKFPHHLTQAIPGRMPGLVFNAAFSGSQPTDPSLAVGPDHVFVVFNTGFRIFDKNGVALTGQLAVENIFSAGGCCDLTVSYDNEADRWVVGYLFFNGNIQVAVSQDADPLTTAWNVYTVPSVDDYNKLSIWSDGYYISGNTTPTGGDRVYALDRAAMLAGDPGAAIIGFPLPGLVQGTGGFYAPQFLNISNNDFPAAGGATVVYQQGDEYAGVAFDHVNLWTIDADFDTPANSTISGASDLVLTDFNPVFDGGSFVNLPQPNGGTSIDALQSLIANQAQFRRFPTHNSAVFSFVVDVLAGAPEQAGIRWVELRQDGDNQPWSVFQEGTYTSPDGKHAWNASLIMDSQGNIGMGYTAMGGTTNTTLSTYYTGRFANDPEGTMTVEETLIEDGTANIPGQRYGDYSKIDVDPSNDRTFWFINEMVNGGRADVVGTFQLAPNTMNDVGIVGCNLPDAGTFGANETITVDIFNFGENEASNFDVTLQIDGGAVVTETFAGPIASQTTESYTFTATADLSVVGQTYEITICTALAGDEDNGNDCLTKMVTNLEPNDIGVTEITAPTTGPGLGNEDVTITIENFGGASQSDFDVSYTVDGGTAVVETVAGPLDPGTTISYTFTTPVDLSTPDSYEICAATLLAGDADASNDETCATIENLECIAITNEQNFPVGPGAGAVTESVITIPNNVFVGDVNVTLNIDHTWSGDLDIFLVGPDGTEVELTSDNQEAAGAANFTNTTFDDDADDPITGGTAPFTGTFQPEGNLSDFNGSPTNGDWTLRITDDANGDGGTLLNWTLELCGDDILDIGENFVEESDLLVIDRGDNQFDVSLQTDTFTERLTLDVVNILGQKLLSYRLDNENGGYNYALDMSYAAAGVYIVRLGNESVGKVRKIIVR